jgi:heme exporter protein D
MIDILDGIGDFFASQPWLSLGIAITALLVISVCMSVFERRQARKRARESRRRAEENLRSRDA